MSFPPTPAAPKMQPIPTLNGAQPTGKMQPVPATVPAGGTEGPVLGGPVQNPPVPYKNLRG